MADASWIASAIGLLGTVIVGLIGYQQWRRSNRQTRESAYLQKRAATLEELVARLQDVQISSRRRQISKFTESLRSINEYMITNRLWLEPTDLEVARDYLDALASLDQKMNSTNAVDLDLYINTQDPVYSPDVGKLFVRLGKSEEALVSRARNAAKRAGR